MTSHQDVRGDFKRLRSVLVVLAATVVMSACATSHVGFYSSPVGADVYVKPMGQGSLEHVGKTPMKIDASTLEKSFNGSGPAYIEFRKDGFNTWSTVITELSSLDLDLNVQMTPASGLEDQTRVNRIVDDMFECQRLAKVHRYQEALDKLKAIKAQTPQIAAVYELEGGIYYLLGKYQDALDSYRLAVRYNPHSNEAVKMVRLIEKGYGLERRPASAEFVNTYSPEQKPAKKEEEDRK